MQCCTILHPVVKEISAVIDHSVQSAAVECPGPLLVIVFKKAMRVEFSSKSGEDS